MIHIYCGDGKGKTTAAMGLALRMAGRGKRVVIARFLKSRDSGECMALEQLPGVTVLPAPETLPFTFQMTPQERERERERYRELLHTLSRLAAQADLLVLDEVCDGLDTGLVDAGQLLALLDAFEGEAVLTGREPAPELLERAGYVTRMVKVRHPYDSGQGARLGVEW